MNKINQFKNEALTIRLIAEALLKAELNSIFTDDDVVNELNKIIKACERIQYL